LLNEQIILLQQEIGQMNIIIPDLKKENSLLSSKNIEYISLKNVKVELENNNIQVLSIIDKLTNENKNLNESYQQQLTQTLTLQKD